MTENILHNHPTYSGNFISPKREVFAIFDMAKWYRSEVSLTFSLIPANRFSGL